MPIKNKVEAAITIKCGYQFIENHETISFVILLNNTLVINFLYQIKLISFQESTCCSPCYYAHYPSSSR